MANKIFNPQNWLKESQQNSLAPNPVSANDNNSQLNDIEDTLQRIESSQIDIAPNYADWRDLGFAFADALGENGRSYYQRVSRFYSGYSASETDRQFEACLKAHGHGVTIKTFFYLAKQAGINVACQSLMEKGNTFQPNSSKSSISSGEEIEDFEELPTFSQIVKNSLPSLLAEIVKCANSPEDADLLLLGSLTVFSACLP